MKIGIDIDGVILDFERQMRFYAEYYDLLNKHRGKINNDYNYLKNYDWTNQELEKFKEEYLILGTLNTSLVPGSKEMIDILHKNNIKIIIITARGSINKKTKEEVIKALNKYNIYYDDIIFEVTDKVSTCKKLNIDIMIDDNPTICYNLSHNKIKTIYFKDNEVKLRKNKYLTTISNWAEIIRYLMKNGYIKTLK